MRIRSLGLVLVLASCGPAPLALNDAGPRPLMCATPVRIDFAAPTTGVNTGVPMAAIAWPGDHCVLDTDEHAPGSVILVADFTGSVFGASGLVASAAAHWAIDTSTTGSAPTTYLTNLPRDTDITVTMHDPTESVSITFRVEASTLVLVEMHRT